MTNCFTGSHKGWTGTMKRGTDLSVNYRHVSVYYLLLIYTTHLCVNIICLSLISGNGNCFYLFT
jgi:hypothetical protein